MVSKSPSSSLSSHVFLTQSISVEHNKLYCYWRAVYWIVHCSCCIQLSIYFWRISETLKYKMKLLLQKRGIGRIFQEHSVIALISHCINTGKPNLHCRRSAVRTYAQKFRGWRRLAHLYTTQGWTLKNILLWLKNVIRSSYLPGTALKISDFIVKISESRNIEVNLATQSEL